MQIHNVLHLSHNWGAAGINQGQEVTIQLIRVRVLTSILKTEVIESIPGKKIGSQN